MKISHRVWMALAALMLIGVYFVPIWSISMEAPQYPEGIGMNITVNNIEGKSENDLKNINGLNHYIGMKPIEPESIPELTIMPYIFGFLILSGLVIAATGKRTWILYWLGFFVIVAIAGLVDFYIWGYDYGHNLNPDAPIKVPGMTYQPPLLGSKQLLNINATSLPHIGFYIALISMGIAGFTWWKSGDEE
ncbi:hypothetical protein [Gracilimonas mengyeensis]|uniref:Copper chaperone NosL n=1 Tax=Gracilimonas mengyeensis TaxID=1302730 RepID=A0A521F1A6_9BACT|nr:hypothetical protein [Gracilimonas mengyeensis]SMO89959.1 hypothetical protein SAMN06265219_114105 [Gracilimonas mengyeensis]